MYLDPSKTWKAAHSIMPDINDVEFHKCSISFGVTIMPMFEAGHVEGPGIPSNPPSILDMNRFSRFFFFFPLNPPEPSLKSFFSPTPDLPRKWGSTARSSLVPFPQLFSGSNSSSNFFLVAAPLKWSKPKKRVPFFSRVTEQLSFSAFFGGGFPKIDYSKKSW